ncbi:2a907f33-e158-4d56-994b-3b6c6a841674 [Sclerotinia trifoliorum]|uniref:2a907f33-e158-4d56-994b-3b6c6a841674 n=1 Tax=Sclerotinia trifoliorum TaxID=28548 RepID=A0A8H2ZQC9_9HELO|nr:2a907f33-e158-4d56-994b-3b6c6a841674 [Sclerotinia trifoliorum]
MTPTELNMLKLEASSMMWATAVGLSDLGSSWLGLCRCFWFQWGRVLGVRGVTKSAGDGNEVGDGSELADMGEGNPRVSAAATADVVPVNGE